MISRTPASWLDVAVAAVQHVTTSVPLALTQRVTPKEELLLLTPLLRWLWATQRLRADSNIAYELSWLGRRVDIATFTRSGRTTAFELKVSHISRALEQAIYNRVVFDRSYVVTASRPRSESLTEAEAHGVGIIIVKDGVASLLLASPYARADAKWRQRLTLALEKASG